MASFTDRKGRAWCLDLDIWLVEEIHKRAGVEIDKLLETGFADLNKAFGGARAFGQFLWVICEEQAKAAGIDEAEFGRGFNGGTIKAATDALLEAIEDFSQPHQRELLRALRERGQEIVAEKVTEAVAKIRALPSIPPKGEAPSAPAPSSTATGSPESPRSTPPGAG